MRYAAFAASKKAQFYGAMAKSAAYGILFANCLLWLRGTLLLPSEQRAGVELIAMNSATSCAVMAVALVVAWLVSYASALIPTLFRAVAANEED